MPLTMLIPGKEAIVDACRAKDSTRKFLEDLGILPGVTVSVISEFSGNLIISIKGSRLALKGRCTAGTCARLIIRGWFGEDIKGIKAR